MDDKIKIIENIILDATTKKSTEVHFHPEADTVSVYYREDNKLTKQDTLSLEEYNKCLRFMKMKTQLSLSNNKVPQDGMFIIKLEGGIDIKNRISTIPLLDNEALIIRIMDGRRQPKFNEIAHNSEELEKIYNEIKDKHGLYICGGSAKENKSTVINSVAEKLCLDQNMKVITLEKTIKTINENFIQIQINTDMKLSYHNALNAAIRQSPDIIIVDQLEDQETVSIAFRAASRGIKVLTTMESKSNLNTLENLLAFGLLSREVDMNLIGMSIQKSTLNEYGEKRASFDYLIDDKLTKFIKSNEQYINKKLAINTNIEDIIKEVELIDQSAAIYINNLDLESTITENILFSNEEITKESTTKLITDALKEVMTNNPKNSEVIDILNKIQGIENPIEKTHKGQTI